MSSLPPLRDLDIAATAADDPRVRVLDGSDIHVALRFGALLAAAREERGLPVDELVLFASAGNPASPPPEPPAGLAWAPHLVAVEERPALIWERAAPAVLELALEAPFEAIAIWAAQPRALLRLATAAPQGRTGEGPYLSLRWLLSHGDDAASAASAQVAFEHVSVHATPDEMGRVRAVLRDALGLVELPRPSVIRVPGHWLAAGQVRVHLNARQGVAPPATGTAPNHICFGVEDLDAAQAAVEARGFACERAGSLERQVWFRLASGTVIELQPRRG